MMMRKFLLAIVAGAGQFVSAPSSAEPSPLAPPGVIYDSDACTDIDDALALAMLHALEDRKEVKLLAVTLTSSNCSSAPYVDLVNEYYGRPNIPIGLSRNAVSLQTQISRAGGKLVFVNGVPTQRVSAERSARGGYLYPHRITSDQQAGDSTRVLRQALAGRPDNSVIMIQVGFSSSLAGLLDSPPDAISALNGRDLIKQKVRFLALMAGMFGPTGGAPLSAEWNVLNDIPAAQKVFETWPTPLIASGVEVGAGLLFPAGRVRNMNPDQRPNPIVDTYTGYEISVTDAKGKVSTTKWPHDHAAFDLTAVLYAARPEARYFHLSPPGRITVTRSGVTEFEPASDGNRRYLIVDDEQKARILDAMVELAMQPPAGRSSRIDRR